MQLPFFFQEEFPSTSSFTLDEETSKHVSQVLRMKDGEQLQLTNGKGQLLTTQIIHADKGSTSVEVTASVSAGIQSSVSIAISLLKNTNRFEWFLEKATEIGVSEIIPLICQHTEKLQFRYDRLKNILVSAMLQSRQAWLPRLHHPVKFGELLISTNSQHKFIAHCYDSQRTQLAKQSVPGSSIILIGPEGDFSKDEINDSVGYGFAPVALGETRLRSETAGVVAATLLMTHYRRY